MLACDGACAQGWVKQRFDSSYRATLEVVVQETFDIVVIGGGAAGLSGAKIAARSRRSVLVIDSGTPRNAPAHGVHNYLYAEGAPPSRLVQIGRAEAAAYGVQIVDAKVTGAVVLELPDGGGPRFSVDIEQDGTTRTVAARRILLATGLIDTLPDIPGMRERWGRDVLHCPFCHGWEVRDQAIGVIGTGPMSLHTVQLFRPLTSDVVYFQHTAPDPTDEQLQLLAAIGVRHVAGPVARIETTDDQLSGVQMSDSEVISRAAVAVTTRIDGRTDMIAELGLAMTELEMGGAILGSYLPTGSMGSTSTPGVWAAGNLSDPMAQVITAASAGAAAGSAIHMDLMAQDNAIALKRHRACS